MISSTRNRVSSKVRRTLRELTYRERRDRAVFLSDLEAVAAARDMEALFTLTTLFVNKHGVQWVYDIVCLDMERLCGTDVAKTITTMMAESNYADFIRELEAAFGSVLQAIASKQSRPPEDGGLSTPITLN